MFGSSWFYAVGGLAIFLVTFVVSVVVIGALLVNLPPTYFLDSHNRNLWIDRHPAIRWAGIIMKNAAGYALLLVGVPLSLPGVPGQGLLTILLGVMLLDFPGKRRLERWILRRPRLLARINWLRGRYHRAPLRMDEATRLTHPEDAGDVLDE